ncbi:uncharacterized protein LOC108198649 [Daucus carota subsp. sativus]|uniref:uncharacterized protein LOC108198649 n=1 Tax=Daucus carota subsp. sativus TaxID=79200 RepID=UPI003082E458
MKEANYNHLKLDNFPTLNSEGSGSALKRSRRVFRSNAVNTKGDEGSVLCFNTQASPIDRQPLSSLTNQSLRSNAQNTNLQLGNINGIRGKSAFSEVWKTPPTGSVLNMSAQSSPNDRQPISNLTLHNLRPNGTIFMENTKASPNDQLPLSMLTNQSLRTTAAYTNSKLGGLNGFRGKSTVSDSLVWKTPPRGSVFNINTQASPNSQTPLSNLTNQNLISGSVFNMNTPSSAKIRPPLSNLTNQSLRYSGSVFNVNTQVSPNSQTPLSNLTNQILRSSGEGINIKAQTNTNNRPSLSQLTNNRSRSSGLKKTAQTAINKDTAPLSNMTNKRKRLNGN